MTAPRKLISKPSTQPIVTPRYPASETKRPVREAVAPIFYRAITGELTPQQALDKMADAAEAELTQLGYRK